MKYIFLLIIKFYKKFISPFLPKACKFYPTCSEYSFIAISKFGVLKGLYLTIKRLLKCNPFSKGGYDPVPDTFKRRKKFVK